MPTASPAQLTPALQMVLVLVPAVALVVNAFAFLLNAFQARRTNRQTRAMLVAEGLKEFMNDREIQKAFYLIEYSKFTYTENFHGSNTERSVDKLLRLFSNLALFWRGGLLCPADLAPLTYYFVRVHGNPEIKKYLNFMSSWTKSQGIVDHPYAAFGELATIFENETKTPPNNG